jgi:glutathione S-transferase
MKVRIVLAEKKLGWAEHFLRSWQFDHYLPEYLALNPHGIVPTLVDDGQAIIQSNVIIEYLDDKYPEPVRLKPDDALLAAKMRKWMAEEQDYLFKQIIVLSFNTMMKLRIEAFGLDRMTAWSKLHPDQARAQDYLKRVAAPADMDAVSRMEDDFRRHAEWLEADLAEAPGPWICGEQFTLADICVGVIFDRVEILDRGHLWSGLPGVTTWFDSLKQRPSYQQGVHPWAYRMWGPRKPVADYPFDDTEYAAPGTVHDWSAA